MSLRYFKFNSLKNCSDQRKDSSQKQTPQSYQISISVFNTQERLEPHRKKKEKLSERNTHSRIRKANLLHIALSSPPPPPPSSSSSSSSSSLSPSPSSAPTHSPNQNLPHLPQPVRMVKRFSDAGCHR